MREIKFRAWDEDGHWIPEPYMLHVNGTICLIRESGHFGYVGSSVILMEFTGLHDKNGKEIYESDLVKVYDEVHEVIWGEPTDYPAFHLKPCQCEDSNCLQYAYVNMNESNLEVTGNIYEKS